MEMNIYIFEKIILLFLKSLKSFREKKTWMYSITHMIYWVQSVILKHKRGKVVCKNNWFHTGFAANKSYLSKESSDQKIFFRNFQFNSGNFASF